MPFGYGGGPWGLYNQRDLRRFWARCFRFPWLPRWWWGYPEYWQEPTPKQEKEMLLEELKALREEMKAIEERLKELETKKEKK
jgi:ubiquinone biosynthesis protein UbiJ